MSTIAFIGLGIMGGPMAGHLAQAGHTVIGYDRSPERTAALVEAGGKAADSIEQAVKDADVVAIMVPDSPDVQSVLAGRQRRFRACPARHPGDRLLQHPPGRHRRLGPTSAQTRHTRHRRTRVRRRARRQERLTVDHGRRVRRRLRRGQADSRHRRQDHRPRRAQRRAKQSRPPTS